MDINIHMRFLHCRKLLRNVFVQNELSKLEFLKLILFKTFEFLCKKILVQRKKGQGSKNHKFSENFCKGW